jgi:serine/threonine protein phosphatase 1
VEGAKPDRLVLVGDIFAKGPDPAGTWEIVRSEGAVAVMGNHDARLLEAWGQPGDSAHHRAARLLPEAARDWVAGLPLFIEEDGWLVVHAGVHPFEGRAATTRKMALTMRRWPDDASLENPFWWQLYAGPTRVYYGHDAMRSVQLHEHSVGLDSGAVYGGQLSGIVRETGEVYQVPGAAPLNS